jgi:hypothetical protein
MSVEKARAKLCVSFAHVAVRQQVAVAVIAVGRLYGHRKVCLNHPRGCCCGLPACVASDLRSSTERIRERCMLTLSCMCISSRSSLYTSSTPGLARTKSVLRWARAVRYQGAVLVEPPCASSWQGSLWWWLQGEQSAIWRVRKRAAKGDTPQCVLIDAFSSLSVCRPCGGMRMTERINEVRYLVDPASSHMLVPKIKPCMSKYKPLYGETANGSLYQL